ncbi:MAG: hypothetical protein WCK86_05050 [Planctomycetia bacterium]
MALSDNFMTNLLDGHLSTLRSLIANDLSLCPEIRSNTLTIYYRGGCLMRIDESAGLYRATFDLLQYAAACTEPWSQSWAAHLTALPHALNSSEEVHRWLINIPYLKSVMDRFYSDRNWRERESQQRIILENNRDPDLANATDFFFCDMEVAENQSTESGLRFDLVGVQWPSTGPGRRVRNGHRLVVAEAKYGDSAFDNLVEHYQDLQTLVRDQVRLQSLKNRMLSAFEQKHGLGFIQCRNTLESFSDDSVIWLLILVNHDPESTLLRAKLNELNQYLSVSSDARIQVRVATSNFMGYGLWTQAVLDWDTFLQGSVSRICCRN